MKKINAINAAWTAVRLVLVVEYGCLRTLEDWEEWWGQVKQLPAKLQKVVWRNLREDIITSLEWAERCNRAAEEQYRKEKQDRGDNGRS